MNRLRAFFHRLGGLGGKARRDRELAAELDAHLQLHIEDNLRRGMSPAEARRQALIQLGGLEPVKEAYRDRRGLPWVETLAQDARFGLRMLRKSPGFAAVAVLTLGLGIGANTAIFSIIDCVLLKPPPFKDPERLVLVWEVDRKNPASQLPVASADLVEWKDQAASFEQLAGWRFLYFNLTGTDAPERVQGLTVSASFFSVLGAQAQLGRTFLPQEEQPGHNKVAILTDALWRRRFAADPGLVGRRIEVEGEPYTVVGVLAPSFHLFQVLNRPLDLFVPFTIDRNLADRGEHDTFVYAQLASGVSREQAQNEMEALYLGLERAYPGTNAGRTVRVTLAGEAMARDVRPALLLLLGATGLILLIACANLGNLLLARGAARSTEMAVRAALGAGRARLVRQLLTESFLLGILGGAAGTLLAYGGIRLLNRVIPHQAVNRLYDFQLDLSVLSFTATACLLSAVLFGLLPAIQPARCFLDASLAAPAGAAGRVRKRRVGNLLVISEVALATALLGAAMLMIRSASFLHTVPRGLNPANVLTLQIWLPRAKYPDGSAVAGCFHDILRRIETLPGVESAAAVNFPPLGRLYTTVRFSPEGREPATAEESPVARVSIISPGYFRTMQIPLLSGRAFTDADSDEANGVAIISSSMAARFWPNHDPIGRQIRPQFTVQRHYWNPESRNLPLTIVGVTADVRQEGLTDSGLPQLYLPYRQNPSSIMNLVVRTAGDPTLWASAVRAAVWAVDKDEPVFDVKTVEDVAADSFVRPRLFAVLLGTFAGLALALAAVGVYGLLSYAVNQRRGEIGVRLALGAQPGDVLQLFLGEGARLSAAGVAIGIVTALGLSRLLTGQLYGVTASDPASYVLAAVLLLGIAVAACYIPARRATRVDPLVALRYE